MSDIIEFLPVRNALRTTYEIGMLTGTVFEYLFDNVTGIYQTYGGGGEDLLKLADTDNLTAKNVNNFLLSMKAHGLPFDFKVKNDVIIIKHGSLTVTTRLCEHAEKSMFASDHLLHRVNVNRSTGKKASTSIGASSSFNGEDLPDLGFVKVENYVPKQSIFFITK